MTLSQILDAVEELSGDELELVHKRISERLRTLYRHIPGENLKALGDIFEPLYTATDDMSEEDVFAVFDEALDEVRREASDRRN